jgi:ParE toxin of type II toxin-antitoxin system, parDE
MPKLRELVIAFGNFGYVALYRHELAQDAVYVLAFRHQKEAGY